jgi:hypothetical protein
MAMWIALALLAANPAVEAASANPAADAAPANTAADTAPAKAAPAPTPAPTGKPSPQAEELGLRLARAGSFAAIAPLLAQRDIDSVVKAHPDWAPEDVALYRKTAAKVAESNIARLIRALGHAYARHMSVVDMASLVGIAEGPAATHRRSVEPSVLLEAIDESGAADFKRDTLAAFCTQMQKGPGCLTK